MEKIKWGTITLFFSTLAGIFFYFLAILVAKNDPQNNYRWVSFCLWIAAIIVPLFLLVRKERYLGALKDFFSGERTFSILLVLLLGIIVNFLFLKIYPFVAIMDEVRDGGWNARQIYEGTIKNIFGWGRYESHGLIIPTLVVPFYLIFGDSVLTYRVPAALVSLFDMFFIYLLAQKLLKKETAFFAPLVLLSLPLHLYYARTEVVVILSSLLTTLIIVSFFLVLKNPSLSSYLLSGLLLGFASGFHASLRAIILITVTANIIFSIYLFFTAGSRKQIVLGVFLMTIFFFVGFGPRILFTSPQIFFHLRTVSMAKPENSPWDSDNLQFGNLLRNYAKIQENYLKSLAAYVKEPVALHFQDPKPILNPLFSVLFVLGILFAVFSKQPFLYFLVFLVFSIPFFNSAITDCVNCDHRWAPVLPVSALLITLGIVNIERKIEKIDRVSFFLRSFLILYIMFQISNFFIGESASKGKSADDYLSMYVVYLIKSLPPQESICLTLSSREYQFFDLMHVKEQQDFLLPHTKIKKTFNPMIPEGKVYLTKDCDIYRKEFALQEYCLKKNKFICPLNYRDPLTIYAERSLIN